MRVYASAEMTLTDTNDGISVTGIDRYYMASSSSSGITVDSQGWKPDPQETNPVSRYHWSYEVVKYSDGAKISSKPAVIGVYGKEGIDAVTVSLSSEAHTFAGTESRAIASSVTIDISAFKGNQRIPTSIGTVTGGISGQLTHSELGRGKTNNKLVINATSSLAKGNGTLSIPVVADGRTFNKVFSWSVAFKGIPGDKGDPGSDGVPGKDGVGVQKTEVHYASSASGTTRPSTGWNPAVPSTSPGDYIWTRTTWTYTDGDVEEGYSVSRIGKDGNTGDDGAPGKDGVGIKETVINYAKSSSGTTKPTSGWTSTIPSVTPGNYLWTRTTWTYTDGDVEEGYSVSRIGEKGDKGDPGSPGIPGPPGANGKPTYTWIRYADTPTSGISNSPVGKKYIGLSFNQTIQTESSNYNDYQWSLMPQNIEIGGRNLLRGSSDFNSSIWSNIGTVTTSSLDSNYKMVEAKGHYGTTPGTTMSSQQGWNFEVGQIYTASVWARTDVSGSKLGETGGEGIVNNNPQEITSEWKRYFWTYKARTDSLQRFRFETQGENYPVWITQPKIEKGNTATDWTPALEDTQSEINDTKEQVKKTVKTITEEYYQSTKSDSLAGGRWTTTAPKWDANKFMFVRSKITYVDGTTDYTPEINLSGAKGDKGDDGKSQWVHIRYSPNPTGSGMTTNPSSTTKYIGIAVTNSATAPAFPEFTWSKYVGEEGEQGPPGQPGGKGDDGKTTYTWVKYADTPTSGMNNFPDGKKYIGLAFNKTTQTESNNYNDYQWSLMPQNIEIGGRNLFIKSSAKQGYVDLDGSITYGNNGLAGDSMTTYPILRVKSGETYYFTKIKTGDASPDTWRIALFSGTGSGLVDRITNASDSFSVTIPSGVTTMRASIAKKARPKIEKGNTATDWAPAPEDIQYQIDGVGIADKTGILAGTEIYTDEADDDSVVHVEIDGKSVQSIDPNAKNMVPTEYDDWMDGYHYAMQDGEPHRYANRMAVPWLIELKPNTNYYLNTGNTSVSYVIRGYDSNFNMVSSSWLSAPSGVRSSEDNVKYIGVSLYTTNSSINVSNEFKNGNIKPLIQEDSNKNRDWVEYIQESPKPQKPMKIHSVGEFSLVSAKGKENILINGNFEDGLNKWIHMAGVAPSIDSLPDHTKHKALRLNNTGNSGQLYLERYEWVTPNQEYTLSWNQIRTGLVIVESADINNNRDGKFRRESTESGKRHQTFTVPSGVYKVRIVLYAAANQHPLYMDLKLEKGDLSPYIPHASELEDGLGDYGYKASFYLPQPLRSVGNTKDKLFRHSDGRWGVERRVRETVLDGSEAWRDRTEEIMQLDNVNWYQFDVRTSNFVSGVGLTSHFSKVSSTYSEDSPHVRIDGGNGTIWLGVFPPKNMHSSLTEFKNWLKDEYSEGRPFTVHRVLSTPVIEWMDDSVTDALNNIVSFSDNNYVFSTVDLEYAGNLLSRVSTLADMWYSNIEPLEVPTSRIGQSATENPIPVKPNQELIMKKDLSLSGDNYWRILYVDELNNPIERRTITSNRLTETVPKGAYGVRVSFPSDSNAQIYYSQDGKAGAMSENLKSTLYATFKGGGWYSRWKTEDELRKYQAEIDGKAGSKELNDTLTIVREEREKLGDLRTELETTQSNLLITHSEEWMNTITETANDVGGMSNRVEIIEQTKEQIDTFFQFDDALTIAKSNAQTKLRLTNDEIQFLDGETKGTYITGNNMVTQNLTIQDKLNLPNHTMESQEDLTIIRFIG